MHTRRTFLRAVVAGAAATTAGLADEPKARPKLAVSTWSFHNYFPNSRYGNPTFPLEEWDIRRLVREAKDGLGITRFEMSSRHFGSTEPDALDGLAEFMADQGCEFIHLSDNIPGTNLADPDPEVRDRSVRLFEELIRVAERLKIPTMRVNTGRPRGEWDINTTIDQYRHLAAFAKERGVGVVVENHFGISADPKNVVRIVEAVGENISSCPDFGLFDDERSRREGLPLMFKHARHITSAKFHGFDANGTHPDFDLEWCYEVMKEAGFDGWVSLEYEGPHEPMPQLQRMERLARRWLGV